MTTQKERLKMAIEARVGDMTAQEDRLRMAVERLVSCRHNIVDGLRAVGRHNLALRVKQDLETLEALGPGALLLRAIAKEKDDDTE